LTLTTAIIKLIAKTQENITKTKTRTTTSPSVLIASLPSCYVTRMLKSTANPHGCRPPAKAGGYPLRRPTFQLILEIDVAERLTVGVADDETGVRVLTDHGGRKQATDAPQFHSSSASRFTAGAAGFLTFTQQSTRPER
jgi:hypothetical protein